MKEMKNRTEAVSDSSSNTTFKESFKVVSEEGAFIF